MDLHLKGKKAIVTGGTRGIGRAIAETLAAEGCDVAICARNELQVNETVEALEKKGVKAFGGTVDISDAEAAWQSCFEIDVLGASTPSRPAPSISRAASGT